MGEALMAAMFLSQMLFQGAFKPNLSLYYLSAKPFWRQCFSTKFLSIIERRILCVCVCVCVCVRVKRDVEYVE